MKQLELQQRVIAALQRGDGFPHAVDRLELFETHISWIVLAGPFAYKLKKAVDLGFLDYSTLGLRHHFCQEELRLNRRTAPELYLEVVAIGGTPAQPQLGGEGPALEWAVKMRRFEQGQLASQQLEAGALTNRHIERLAANIARFHHEAAVAGAESPFGSLGAVYQPIEENFRQIREQLPDNSFAVQLQALERWYGKSAAAITPLLEQRKRDGYIRECHGDLHLNNIVLLDDEPCPFDGIEFNDNLRYVDVISDIAFLLMDLDYRQHSDLGWVFLDSYLQESGDYAGLVLLRFYQVYRAMVRAKVAAIRSRQQGVDDSARQAALAEVEAHLELAQHYTQRATPQLLLTHGFSGSGKSTVVKPLLMAWGAIRLRSDVERKRLFGMAPREASGSTVAGGIYSASASQRTYEQLARLSESLLEHGFNVIVDATFLRRSDRQQFIAMAKRHGVAWHLLDVQAGVECMRERISARHATQHDPSEADLAILDYQLKHHDPLGDGELLYTIHLDTEGEWSVSTLLTRIQQQAP